VSEKNPLPKRAAIKGMVLALLVSVSFTAVAANLVMAREEAPEKQRVMAP
jgi:hypothetical protein